jgi:hypothetical protein
MCYPWRGFLIVLELFSHHFRGGLRCDVPPGLLGTELVHFPRVEGRLDQTVTFRLAAIGGGAELPAPPDWEVMKPPICCKSDCSVEKACCAL